MKLQNSSWLGWRSSGGGLPLLRRRTHQSVLRTHWIKSSLSFAHARGGPFLSFSVAMLSCVMVRLQDGARRRLLNTSTVEVGPAGAQSEKVQVPAWPARAAMYAANVEERLDSELFSFIVNNTRSVLHSMLARPALRPLSRGLVSAAPNATPRSAVRRSLHTPSPSSPHPARPFRPTHARRPSLRRRLHATPPRSDFGKHAPPLPQDLPPISERLKPLIPFLIWWTIITSLAVHLLRKRKQNEEELNRLKAQQSVLQDMIARFQAGEMMSDDDIRRELEMVGLRKRKLTLDAEVLARVRQQVGSGPALDEITHADAASSAGGAAEEEVKSTEETPDISELRQVSWLEVLLGRKRGEKVRETISEDEQVVKFLAEGKSVEEAKVLAKEAVEKMHEEDAVKEWTESELICFVLGADSQSSLRRTRRPRRRPRSPSRQHGKESRSALPAQTCTCRYLEMHTTGSPSST